MMEFLENNLDTIIFILFAITGISLCVYNVHLLFKGQKTLGWTLAKGKIIKSEMGISQSLTRETFENYYRADIEYEYELLGNKFKSNQAYLGDKVYLTYDNKAEKILKMFPANKTVNVYVNPDNHSDSVLIRGSGGNRVLNIALGLILIFIGIFVQSNFDLIKEFLVGLKQ
ncbi:MAG: DUF3592 domain-containing protein [Ignavibacteriaceae bacterium]